MKLFLIYFIQNNHNNQLFFSQIRIIIKIYLYPSHNSMNTTEIKIVKNHVKVPGGYVYSELHFTQENKSKVHVVSLHGGPGGIHNKMKWGIRGLADYFPIIFYDQIGGGLSKNRITINKQDYEKSLWNIEHFVSQLQEIIKFYKLQKFILLGTSWGSTLALQYYFSENTSPKPIAMHLNSPLVDSNIWTEDTNFLLKQQLQPQIYEKIKTLQKNKMFNSAEYLKVIILFNKKFVCRNDNLTPQQKKINSNGDELFNDQVYQYMWGPSEFTCSGTLQNYSRYNDLSKINIPILFSCGQFDEARPETVSKFHEKVAQSQFHIFKNCSHSPHYQDSQKFKSVLLQFYKTITEKTESDKH